jgi:hypothetical protein
MRGGEVFECPMEWAGVLLQGEEITIGFIGLVLLPASKVNAHEFIGQGAAGLVVLAFVTLFLLVVIALGPRFLL